jgi:hypothetical protein
MTPARGQRPRLQTCVAAVQLHDLSHPRLQVTRLHLQNTASCNERPR